MMTSASAPSSVVSHDDSSPAAAFRHSSRKRLRRSASNGASGSFQRARPAARQKARISAGAASQASVMNRRPRRSGSGGGSLVFIPQFAAQDFSDIGLRQAGPEFDLLGDLVVGQLRAAELDDVLGGDVWILFDDERLDGFARARVGNAHHGAFQHAGVTG